jgi:glycosyltransferase involved in cell wall biosynthesis
MTQQQVSKPAWSEAIRRKPESVSVVIPLYNEKDSLEELHRRLNVVLTGLGREYEIIYVDDGSNDGSHELLKHLVAKDRRFKLLRFRRNFGKSAALNAGFKESVHELVISIDADLQDIPEEIPSLLNKMQEGFDLVSSWKQNRKDPLIKVLASRFFNYFTALSTGVRIHDINSGFKCYRRAVLEEISVYGDMHRYIPVLASYRGFHIGEVRVRHDRRKHGKSKFGPSRYFGGLFDLLTVIMLTRYNRKPLHAFGILGVLLFGAGLAIDSYLALGWIFGHWIGDRPLLLLGTLLMIIGIQFIFFGLMAEMIAYSSAQRDEYALDRTSGREAEVPAADPPRAASDSGSVNKLYH